MALGVYQINRRFAAACAPVGLEGRRTPHGGRVGLAVELTARGASTRDVQLAGGWKNAGTVARYAARVGTNGGAVSRFMRGPGGGRPADRPRDSPRDLARCAGRGLLKGSRCRSSDW